MRVQASRWFVHTFGAVWSIDRTRSSNDIQVVVDDIHRMPVRSNSPISTLSTKQPDNLAISVAQSTSPLACIHVLAACISLASMASFLVVVHACRTLVTVPVSTIARHSTLTGVYQTYLAEPQSLVERRSTQPNLEL